jgi:hypothetical protein
MQPEVTGQAGGNEECGNISILQKFITFMSSYYLLSATANRKNIE